MDCVAIDRARALQIFAMGSLDDLYPILTETTSLRQSLRGNTLRTCAIVNAKCGNCSENCSFCPQSRHAKAAIKTYPLMRADEIVEQARAAEAMGASNFGIVTSGRTIHDEAEFQTLCTAVSQICSTLRITPCASLGILTYEQLCALHAAGLKRYHHNLETARSYYDKVCTTRTYDDQIRTIRDAARAHLHVCSGALFGLGETVEQRIELFETLREEKIDSVPINFLHPQPGTALENAAPLTPLECLKIVCVARLMLPESYIRICGGREHNVRQLQPLLFAAGADAVMIGNYLMTRGRTLVDDFELFADAHLRVVFEPERTA